MPEPAVSVLMTCYNRDAYIATAIESVLGQSFQNWELIIVDDASTDQSFRVAQAYATKEPRIRLYRNEANMGDYRNRNRAASLARGRYLKYVDSDDAIYPHCLAVMVYMMERHPEAGLLICAWSENDGYYPFVLSPLEAYRRHFILGERMSNSPLTCLYRRDRFEEVGRFNLAPPGLSCDYDLVLRLARSWPVVVAPTGLCFYRVHNGQVSRKRGDTMLHRTPVGVQIQLRHLRHPKCPLPEPERRWAIGKSMRLGLRFAMGLALKKLHPVNTLHLVGQMKPRMSEMANIFARRPVVGRPKLPENPDWSEFPDAVSAGVDHEASKLPKVAVLVCGDGGEAQWRRTLDSLYAQWLSPRVTAVLNTVQMPFRDSLAREFPGLDICVAESFDPWASRNIWARSAAADLIKFAKPGAVFYPYALYLEAQGLDRFPKAQCVAAGSFGPTLYPTLISFKDAETLDRRPNMCAFRMLISCITLRRDVIGRHSVKRECGELLSYDLIRRCAEEGGLITAHEGLCSDHFPNRYIEIPGSMNR